MDERALLEGLRAGNEAAFEAMFRAFYAEMAALARVILRDQAAAEDVAQDVLLEIWRRRENIVPESSLRAYLLRAVRNRALNTIRHERIVLKLEPELPAPGSLPAPDRALLTGEMKAALTEAVAALPERCREVFQLSRVQGLRYAEIGQVLGISVKTVEAQMGKAIRLIRERLAPWI